MHRRGLILSLLAASLLTVGSCRPSSPKSTVRVSDLRARKQLLSGFYALEAGAWRWTGQDFKVSLARPGAAASAGGILIFQGTLPQAALNATNGVTLTARIGPAALASRALTTAGPFIYRVDVPASALQESVVVAEFHLDKTFRPAGDARDLGVVASLFSLQSK